WLQNLNIDWQSLLAKLTDVLQSGALDFIDGAVGVATSIVSGATSFVIGLIFACYLLLDKEHLSAQLEALLMAYLPKARFDKLMDLAKLTYRSYAKFVSGQLIEALIVTVIYIVVLHIGQFDYALLISVLIGFFSLIPMIGIIIGCAIGALLLLVSMGFWRAVIFLGVCFVVQQFEGNIIYPRVVGTSVGLPPVWVLVAVTVGGGLAGIPGMLFFIPLFSVLYTLLHRDARRRLAKKGIASPVGALPQRVPRSARKPRRRFSRRRGRPDDHDDS
ncbi:MAG: AI-2E family transporter, partial [Oscillospiraceae bacterium]